MSAGSAEQLPTCIDGSGTCPPEECGGPDDCHALREEATGRDTATDLGRVAGFIERIVIQRDLSGIKDELWRAEAAADRCSSRLRFLEGRLLRGPVNKRFRTGEHLRFMHQHIMQDRAGQGEQRLVKQAPKLSRLRWPLEIAAGYASAACRP